MEPAARSDNRLREQLVRPHRQRADANERIGPMVIDLSPDAVGDQAEQCSGKPTVAGAPQDGHVPNEIDATPYSVRRGKEERMTESAAGFSYHAFLSHKYKAPEVNLHFFELFSSVGEVQFKVDRGTSRISMTRLHRMVRDADAFIGIYPLPGSVAARPTRRELGEASQYFRLELDLAVRSRKPAIIFHDNRYRSVLRVPAGIYQYGYDAQEIAGKGGTPTVGRHQFTPLLFLKRTVRGTPPPPPDLERSLFGAFEVGYSEDVVTWSDADALLTEVRERLAVIEAEIERFNTIDEARGYFMSAGRRKERVFLSYAGEDLSLVAGLQKELKRRFQEVFDYRTAGAIAPGSDWMPDLFTTLSRSAVGVICLSKHYLASGNCLHEAEDLMAQRDQGRTKVFVVNLDDSQPPEYMRNVQYCVPGHYAGDEGLVGAIVEMLGPEKEL